MAIKILASPYRETSDLNPGLSLLYESLEQAGAHVASFSEHKLLRESWDIWHLHWPESMLIGSGRWATAKALVRFRALLKLAQFRGTRIVWTVHNLRPHERQHPVLEWLFWQIFLRNIHGIISMSETGRQLLLREHPRARSVPIFTIRRGHYRGAYPDGISKDAARLALGLPEHESVMLFLGQIRPYKGVPQLIQSFLRSDLPDTKLVIAGTANERMIGELKRSAGESSNIRIHAEFVPHDAVQKFLRAADLVVLPYLEILNSGSAILALSFDRPIVVPRRGALAELHRIVGEDWVYLYDGDLGPDIIRSAVRWYSARQVSPDARAPLDGLDWEHTAMSTIRAFSAVLGKDR